MRFARQEYWSGLPFPSAGCFSDPGTEPASPALIGGFFTTEQPGKPLIPVCAVLCLEAQLFPTLCDSMDCSSPGSSVQRDSPGKNTGVGCHALLQQIFPTQGSNPSFPHCRWILYHLSHQGSPISILIFVTIIICLLQITATEVKLFTQVQHVMELKSEARAWTLRDYPVKKYTFYWGLICTVLRFPKEVYILYLLSQLKFHFLFRAVLSKRISWNNGNFYSLLSNESSLAARSSLALEMWLVEWKTTF